MKTSIYSFIFVLYLGMISIIPASDTNNTPTTFAGTPLKLVCQDKLSPLPPGQIQISGYLGHKLDLCVSNRVMLQNVDACVEPFKIRNDGLGGFRGEFWGKWYTSAMLAYGYTQQPEHLKIVEDAIAKLIQTQADDGYIGTNGAEKEHRTDGFWNIWGRKYALLGMIANFDQTGNQKVLESACRAADCLIEEIGATSGKNIAATGWVGWKGLDSCSVLEPIVLLYQRTGEPRYLEFADTIVRSWDHPNRLSPTGLRLIQNVFGDAAMWKMSGAPKAYEMTSCFEGLCELYRATGNDYYFDACKKLAENILRDEITIIGSGSMAEIWCNTRKRQTEPMYHAMETCVTATWLKYLYQLLRLTGESRYADEMEITLYNALIAAQMPQGNWWAYFTPLMGERTASHIQFPEIGSSCCVANGPRALMLTPYWAIMGTADGPAVNLYAPLKAQIQTPAHQKLTLNCETEYPAEGSVKITMDLKQPESFMLKLRIPGWSRQTTLSINGEPYQGYIIAGTYAHIERTWKTGDVIELGLDMRTRVQYAPAGTGDQALIRGPLVLSFDSRLIPPQPDPQSVPMYRYEFHHSEGDFVDVKRIPSPDPNIWLTFEVPVQDESGALHTLPMCDYTSAGNLWGEGNVFRTWIQQPFDVRHLYIILDWRVNTHVGVVPQIPDIYKK